MESHQNLSCSIWPSVPQFVELRPVYWTCSTYRRAVPHFRDAVPQIVELLHFVPAFLDTAESAGGPARSALVFSSVELIFQ